MIDTLLISDKQRRRINADRVIAAGLFTCFLILYLVFRSISLDDFDSVSFAFALKNFDLALQQPQPPGFPVYILLGRLFLGVFNDPVIALTSLSALSGACAIPLVFWIGRLLDPHHTRHAFIAAVCFGLLPVTWLTSVKALSDGPGLTAVLLAMALWLWAERTSDKAAGQRRLLAAFSSGIAFGLRPQNTLPLVLLVLGLFVNTLMRGKWQRSWAYAILAGAAGIMVWLIPVSINSGGLNAYVSYIQGHAEHVGRADSFFGLLQTGMPWTAALNARLSGLRDTSLLSLTGNDPFVVPNPRQGLITLVISLFGLAGLIFAPWRKRWLQGSGVWLLGILVQSLLTITLDRPRLLLPLMPPLCLIVAAGWTRLSRLSIVMHAISRVVYGIVFMSLLNTGLPLVQQIATAATPPVQALTYVRESWPSDQTLIATAGSFRHAQYVLPDYPLIYLYQFDGNTVTSQVSDPAIRAIAILDRDQFPSEAVAILRKDDTFVTLEDKVFSRSRAVHTQHDQVRLQILVRAEDIPSSALRLPSGGCVDLGSDLDGKYLGSGWFRGETVGGASARWAGDVVTSSVQFTINEVPVLLHLKLRGMSYHTAQTITVQLNGQAIGQIRLGTDWTDVEISLSPDLIATHGINELDLVHSALNAPYVISNGSSADQRRLSVAYDFICLLSD